MAKQKLVALNVIVTFLFVLCAQSAAQSELDACEVESAALNLNENVMKATGDFETEVSGALSDFTDFCSLFKRSCSADLSEYSSDIRTACEEEGGNFVEQNHRMKCKGKIKGIPIFGGFKIIIDKLPACLATTCDPDNLPTEVTSAISTILDDVEAQIESSMDVDCRRSGSASLGGAHMALVAASITSLFSWIFL